MNSHNIPFAKPIFLPFIVFIVAFVFLIPAIDASHNIFTKTLTSAADTVTFRDTSNTDVTTQSVSLDKSNYLPGDTAIVTVLDRDANFDPDVVNSVESTANSTTSGSVLATSTLTETNVNSGIFTGNIILSSSTTTGNQLEISGGDSINVFYDPDNHMPTSAALGPPASGATGFAAFFADFGGVSGSTNVDLVDYPINTSSRAWPSVCPFDTVVHPVAMTFSGNPATGVTVTMSYANAILEKSDGSTYSISNLEMIWRPAPGAVFQSLGAVTNTAAKTITNTIQPTDPSIGGTSESGQYSIGVNLGCAGGGGGGLVRPGLVVNILAGSSALGGGGAGPPGPTLTLAALAKYDSAVETISMPQEIRDMALNYDPYTSLEQITDIYEDFDFPLSINGNGFVLGGYENTLETQTIEPGEPTEFVVVYYTNSELAHSSLNFNLGPTRTIQGSDTQVLLYKDKPPEIIDPNGNIASFTGSINNEGDLKRVATFLVTFSESAELPNPDIVIRTWTTELSSGDTIIYDAIEIAQPEIVEIADEDIPEPEIQTLKSQYVPIWIKNNAAWWSQELIADSDFIAGIEYLIQQDIITLSDTETLETSGSDEIPIWIKNNAGWWSDDLISEKEFIDGLQWLITNGIIKVVEA